MAKTSRVPLDNMTADEVSSVFFRALGWLRLKTGDGSGLWINPFTRSLASFDGAVLLTTGHETDAAFCQHFIDTAYLCVQRDGAFPTANVCGAKMPERLRALGLDPIIDGDNDGE